MEEETYVDTYLRTALREAKDLLHRVNLDLYEGNFEKAEKRQLKRDARTLWKAIRIMRIALWYLSKLEVENDRTR